MKKTSKQIDSIVTQFETILAKKRVSPRTVKEYVFVARQLLSGQLTAASITSKSKLSQAKSVEKKLRLYKLIDKTESFELPEKFETESDPITLIEEKYVPEEDFKRFLDALPKTDKGKELLLACRFAYHGGFRLEEVLSLKSENFRVEERIVVRFKGKGRGKKKKARFTRLPKSFTEEARTFQPFAISYNYTRDMTKQYLIRAAVKTYIEKDKKVILVSKDEIKARMVVMDEDKEIIFLPKEVRTKTSFHGFRHSFATNLAKAGVPVHVIQALLGHSNIAITGRYMHFFDYESCPELENLGY